MKILGISAFYHDSAACLIDNGEILVAVQEERFTRIKHDSRFPINSINYCLNFSKINPQEIDYVVFYEKPFLKFERLLETYLAFAPKGFSSFSKSMPLWIKDKLFQKNSIIKELSKFYIDKKFWNEKLLFSEHHLSHAASAFYPSPFNEAAILTIDGVGEWSTTSVCVGKDKNISILKEINFPHSLGLLYSAFTYFAGFKVNSGEYKLMGLAPYGIPKYENIIRDKLIQINSDGSYILNMEYFNYCVGLKMTNEKFNKLFDNKPRKSETKITQKEMDLAASIQKVTEEVVIKLARNVKKETNKNNLCLAGGVALNCVANGKLIEENIFDNIWIQPASGDSGGALGAALLINYDYLNEHRNIKNQDSMKGSYLGPSYDDKEIENELAGTGAVFEKFKKDKLIDHTTEYLIKGKAVGWMQGRMEFGPRALGARSILADPRSRSMQKQLNLKVKYRESFRPFAPSILKEESHNWFELQNESPYMLLVSKINKDRRIKLNKNQEKLFGIDKLNIPKSEIPATTHIDYTSRIQTVDKNTNEMYHKLIKSFFNKTGCPVLVNTSFNIRGEPIVCSPNDAYRCFMGTDLDILVIGNYLFKKEDQPKKNVVDYKEKFDLD